MGGNVILKHLGEQGINTKVDLAISISNPFDMLKASRKLQNSYISRNTYSRQLCKNAIGFVMK